MACLLGPRNRSRTGFSLTGRYKGDSYCNGRLTKEGTPQYAVCSMGSNESISDEINVKSDFQTRGCDPKRIFKNVFHTKATRSPEYGSRVAALNVINTCGHYVIEIDTHWWWSKRSVFDYVPYLSPSELELSSYELYSAIGRLEPTFDDYLDGVNLWAIILELGQLKNLLGTFVMKSKDLLENVADKHLTYSFGIVPLQSDIEKMIGIFRKLDGVIEKWNQYADSRQILDFHETVSTSDFIVFDQEGNGGPSPVSGICTVTSRFDYKESKKARVHCYGTAVRIPDNKRFMVMIQALGLDKPLTGLWEATPFSWVVDYFTNVGDLIASWEEGLDNMFRINVTSAGYSTYIEYAAQVRIIDQGDEILGSGLLMSSYDEETGSIFRRQRLPHKSLFKDAKAKLNESMRTGMFLGWRQASYLAALAYLKSRR